MSYRLKIKEAFEKTQNIDEQETPAQQAASFDNKKSYYQQPENQVNILKPLVRAWRTNPDIQKMKRQGMQINDLSKIYIEKFEENVGKEINLEELIAQTIEAAKAQKGAQAKPEAKQAPAATAAAPSAAAATATPPAPASTAPQKTKYVSPIRSAFEKVFPDIKFSAQQINFITGLMKRSRIFSLEEAQGQEGTKEKKQRPKNPKESIIEDIVEEIFSNEMFSYFKRIYGEEVFKKNLTKALRLSLKRQATEPAAPPSAANQEKQTNPTTSPPVEQNPQIAAPSVDFRYSETDPREERNLKSDYEKLRETSAHNIATFIRNEFPQFFSNNFDFDAFKDTIGGFLRSIQLNKIPSYQHPYNDDILNNQEVKNYVKEQVEQFPTYEQFRQKQLEKSKTSDESLYEGLFNKFVTNKQPNNSKQLFSFDGNKFKKYNRG